MPAKINYQIGISSLDLIRVKLIDILSVELLNQATLYGDDDYIVNAFVERFTALNQDQYPALNVRFVEAELESQDQTGSVYKYSFWIEYYTSNQSDDDSNGREKGAIRTSKVLTACREILKHPFYKTLDIIPNIIGSVKPTTIQVSEQKYNQNNMDGLDIMYARMSVDIQAKETVGFQSPFNLSEYEALLQLYSTDKSIKFGFTNP